MGLILTGIRKDRTASDCNHMLSLIHISNNTEAGRGWKSSCVDPRNRQELYLEPFRRAIMNGRAEGVMTAYNKINGIPGMLNPEVSEILKKEYGLKGHVRCV